jgi:hypothetical protein
MLEQEVLSRQEINPEAEKERHRARYCSMSPEQVDTLRQNKRNYYLRKKGVCATTTANLEIGTQMATGNGTQMGTGNRHINLDGIFFKCLCTIRKFQVADCELIFMFS